MLEGDIDDIVASARQRAALPGVTGLDPLAYRFAGDVPTLIRRVCDAVDKPVLYRRVHRPGDRIAAVVTGNAVGFTVGTAALDGVFPPTSGADGANQRREMPDWQCDPQTVTRLHPVLSTAMGWLSHSLKS